MDSMNSQDGAAIVADRKMVVYVDANCTNEAVEGPTFCRFVVTSALAKRVRELKALCVNHGLSEARVWMEPDRWGAGDVDVEDGVSMDAAELVVAGCQDLLWFSALLSVTGGSVQTEVMGIDALLEAFDSGRTEFRDQLDEDRLEDVERDEARERGEDISDAEDEDEDGDEDEGD